jgi:hypothetical protein
MISPSSGIALASQIVEYLVLLCYIRSSYQIDRDLPSERAGLKNSPCVHSLREQVQELAL